MVKTWRRHKHVVLEGTGGQRMFIVSYTAVHFTTAPLLSFVLHAVVSDREDLVPKVMIFIWNL